jgi:hypothetical protein
LVNECLPFERGLLPHPERASTRAARTRIATRAFIIVTVLQLQIKSNEAGYVLGSVLASLGFFTASVLCARTG